MWSFRDVTESKQIAYQLCESERRFRDLFENAPLPYQSLDREGNILHVNQAWLELTGYQLNQVITGEKRLVSVSGRIARDSQDLFQRTHFTTC